MATYTFTTPSLASIKERINAKRNNNPTVNKVVDTTLDTCEYIGKNADTFLLGGIVLLLGDIAEAQETLTLVETIELMEEHPHLF